MDPPRAPCPVCGAYSITHDTQTAALVAVCDVLVVKALETVGKFIVRHGRERFRQLGTRPWHVAHTLFPIDDDALISKATKGAWDVVPAMLDAHGCCEVTAVQITVLLEEYVHDLVLTGTGHSLAELAYRFESRLGLPVWSRAEAGPGLRVGG